jgi:hypothetical protein
MVKLNLIASVAFLALLAVPTAGFAADGATSYSLKKQNRVHFQDAAEESSEAEVSYENQHPADIEPAAGGFEAEDKSEDALAESMKLPRK